MNMRIRDLLSGGREQQRCTVSGWVRSLRASKEVAFIVLNDGSCLSGIQVVAGRELEDFPAICRIGTVSALHVEGELLRSPRPKPR